MAPKFLAHLIIYLLLIARAGLPTILMADNDPGGYDRIVELAVKDFARHEKRLLSTSDVFDVHFYPEVDKMIVSAQINDYSHNNYIAVVNPKDTTINPTTFTDEEKIVWTWVSPSSDTIMVVNWPFDADKYEVSYSLDDVSIDYSGLPNRMLEAAGKLFVWRDDTRDESREVIDRLIRLERVDFWAKGLIGWFVDNDGEETVVYDMDALRQGKIRKYHNYGLFGDGFHGWLRTTWFKITLPWRKFWHPYWY